MTLFERCKRFMAELGIPCTQFCKRIELSRTALYEWGKGNLNLAEGTLHRIENYIGKFGF